MLAVKNYATLCCNLLYGCIILRVRHFFALKKI